MDFLSFLTIRKNPNPECAVLVLNLTNLWRYALLYIENNRFTEIELFLDNDTAGDAVAKQFTESQTTAKIKDMRGSYEGFDDFNAWLMAT